MDYPIVTNLNEGTVLVSYLIRSTEWSGGLIEYDWVTDASESDGYFETAEEAAEDLISRYGN